MGLLRRSGAQERPSFVDAAQAPRATEAGRYDAFLSYSRKDSEFVVDRLRAELHERGHEVWVDVDILAGATWRARVKRGIEACKALIFVVSPDSVVSQACRDELEDAVALHKLIIPVVYRDVDERVMPEALADAEWVLLRDGDDPAAGLDRLVEALETDLQWRDQHTRLAGRTREWLDSDRDGSYLLRGSDLREAEAWLVQHEGHREAPTREQGEYIARSRQAAARRLSTLIGGLTAGLVVAVGLAIFALIQRQHAIDETHVSRSQLLAREATGTADLQLASLLAAEAYRMSPTFDARDAVLTVAENRQLGRPFTGHTDTISDIAFSPDGRTLAATGDDHTILLWDIASHRRLGTLRPFPDNIPEAVAFSPDGRTLAVGSYSNMIQLWDVASHDLLGTMAGPAGSQFGIPPAVRSVAFSPDGRTLASAGDDRKIVLWDVARHRQIGRPLTGHRDQVNNLAFSRDGRTLASGGLDHTVRLWDVTTHRELGKPLTDHSKLGATSFAFSPNGRVLAWVSTDHTVGFWGVARHRELGELTDKSISVGRGLAFGLDGRTLMSKDGPTVRFWDLATGRQIGETSGSGEVFSPDGRTLASSDVADNAVRLWDTASYRQVDRPLLGHTNAVTRVAFWPAGRTLASASLDDTVRSWDVSRRHQTGTLVSGPRSSINAVSFSPDGRTLATASSTNGTIRLWDATTHRQLGSSLSGGVYAVNSLAFSPDGRTLASTSSDYTARLWDVASHRQLGKPLSGVATSDRFWGVAFSPDGRTLATGNDRDTVRLWDVASHRQLEPPLKGSGDYRPAVFSVAFSPDGRMLASAGASGTVHLWDVASHRQLGRQMTGHTDWVNSLAFSPDGRTLASASRDHTIRLWDVANYRQLGPPLTGHVDSVTNVAFSPDGQMLASASGDGTVRLWSNPSVDVYIRRLCSHIDLRQAPQLFKEANPSIPYTDPC